MTYPEWLPGLVLFEDHGGNWSKYLSAIYAIFVADFKDNSPIFRGSRITLMKRKMLYGKDATFWHMTSEGEIEQERLPDFRRCERIRWPRPIIENSDAQSVKVWENMRKRESRLCLWLEDAEYLVILAKRKRHLFLMTAYPVTQPHRKRKLQKEYEESLNG